MNQKRHAFNTICNIVISVRSSFRISAIYLISKTKVLIDDDYAIPFPKLVQLGTLKCEYEWWEDLFEAGCKESIK